MKRVESERLVSVIIPVYNCERYLAEAIESALQQTYRPVEVIVIDDGSTDGSAVVAQTFGAAVRYCYQPHSGIGAALNHGVFQAKGEFLAFLDADDLWVRDKLERQMAALGANSRPALVFGHVQQFVSPDLDADVARRLRCPPELMPGYMISALLVRKDTFDLVGTFETRWLAGEFLDWCLRATDLGIRTVMLPDLVLRRRLHRTNHGIVERDAKVYLTRALKAALDRRRARAGQGR